MVKTDRCKEKLALAIKLEARRTYKRCHTHLRASMSHTTSEHMRMHIPIGESDALLFMCKRHAWASRIVAKVDATQVKTLVSTLGAPTSSSMARGV